MTALWDSHGAEAPRNDTQEQDVYEPSFGRISAKGQKNTAAEIRDGVMDGWVMVNG
jgi:hypothetical protein